MTTTEKTQTGIIQENYGEVRFTVAARLSAEYSPVLGTSELVVYLGSGGVTFHRLSNEHAPQTFTLTSVEASRLFQTWQEARACAEQARQDAIDARSRAMARSASLLRDYAPVEWEMESEEYDPGRVRLITQHGTEWDGHYSRLYPEAIARLHSYGFLPPAEYKRLSKQWQDEQESLEAE